RSRRSRERRPRPQPLELEATRKLSCPSVGTLTRPPRLTPRKASDTRRCALLTRSSRRSGRVCGRRSPQLVDSIERFTRPVHCPDHWHEQPKESTRDGTGTTRGNERRTSARRKAERATAAADCTAGRDRALELSD